MTHEQSNSGAPAEDAAAQTVKRHLLTVNLEDYYQVGAFNRLIQRGQWYRFESRVAEGTRRTLELLDDVGINATFFVVGWIAEEFPEIVREVAERGHEVASKGFYHRSIRSMAPEEFREDLARARAALESASGQRVVGYRVADAWMEPSDLWALDVLVQEGYEYDSSIGPMFRAYAGEQWRRFAHQHRHEGKALWEFPISTAKILGTMFPIAGGNYFRQLPKWLIRHEVEYWHRTYSSPFVMYFHTWEMDPDQPRISAAGPLQRIRHYRNLRRMPDFIRYYLGKYRFTNVADYLGLGTVLPPERREIAVPRRESRSVRVRKTRRPEPGTPRTPVTIVAPCYNEELVLPYLANTLSSVEEELSDRYAVDFLFVDDRSTDGTWDALHNIFGEHPNCRFYRHDENQGVAAAIMTGIRNARTEVVCSIDADCTYDPHELGRMIPLLGEDVDMVTASPYHPEGQVRNVPGWRLSLSRTLSALYRRVLYQKMHTYTSCFRVYRRSVIQGVELTRSGFLGVAEMLGKVDLSGSRIIEFPTTLEVRMLGRSKMKILTTILGHLELLASLFHLRIRGGISLERAIVPLDSAPRSHPESEVRRAGEGGRDAGSRNPTPPSEADFRKGAHR